MVRCIHIAPELPPTVGGVADYTAILSRRLVEVSDRDVEPVLVHAGNQSRNKIEVNFPSVNLSGKCSTGTLAETIKELAGEAKGPAVVLLEYANYGYALNGVPWWLLHGLMRVCGSEKLPLIVMLHELYATGPPWTSAFWYSVPQRFVAIQLSRLAQHVCTNRASAKQWVSRYTGPNDQELTVHPVFSNVGEPEGGADFESRTARVVMFGGKKNRIYRENPDVLHQLVNTHEFGEVIDIGPLEDDNRLAREWLTYHGILPAERISETLSSSSLGLISYPSSRLSKSGGVAAFASHGMPFVLIDEDEGGDPSPYEEGTHFFRWSTLSESTQVLTEQKMREMSEAISSLYSEQMHSRLSARHFLQAINRTVFSQCNLDFS